MGFVPVLLRVSPRLALSKFVIGKCVLASAASFQVELRFAEALGFGPFYGPIGLGLTSFEPIKSFFMGM